MMNRIKKWLYNRFLPILAKETILRECEELRRQNEMLTEKNKLLNAYIDGLENAMRANRKIIINATKEVSQ